MTTLHIEDWPLERLVPYAQNPRKNDHAVAKMVEAIRTFGFRIPVLAKSDGELIDGHLLAVHRAMLEVLKTGGAIYVAHSETGDGMAFRRLPILRPSTGCNVC